MRGPPGLEARAEDWKWGSLSCWLAKREAEPQRLSPRPIRRSPGWKSRVNAALSRKELQAVRRCVTRGSPFGDETWARRLGLESTLSRRGRPEKES